MIRSNRKPKAINGVMPEGETKSAQLTVRLRPSVKAAAMELLHDRGQSLNDFLCRCAEEYVRQNTARLEQIRKGQR